MADAHVKLLDDTVNQGKKMQTVSNVVGADTVHAEAVYLVNESGVTLKTADNKLRTLNQPYLYAVAEGIIPDHDPVRIFGHNLNVPVTFEAVAGISAVYPWFTAAERLHVISTDADDTGGGADVGARTLTIVGLNDAWEPISETITLNGLAGYVVTAAFFYRIFKAFVATAGTTGTNEGIISIKNTAEAVTHALIDVGEGHTQSAVYTVPLGKTLYLSSFTISEASSKGSSMNLFVRPFGGAWMSLRAYNLLDSAITIPFLLPMTFGEKTDIMVQAKAIIAGADVTAELIGWIE